MFDYPFTVGRLGVPVFFFLTGYLLLDREYDEQRILMFYKKNLLGIFVTVELWNIIYNIVNIWNREYSFSFYRLIKNILFIEQSDMSHMWYMSVIMGIYIFLPFVARSLRQCQIQTIWLCAVVVFISCFVIPEINVMLSTLQKPNVGLVLDLGFGGGTYGFCVILGYMLKKGLLKRLHTISLGILSAIMYGVTVWIQVFAYEYGQGYAVWYNCASLVLCAACIFELISRCNLDLKFWDASLSRYSFGIYLLHNIVIECMGKKFSISSGIGGVILLFCTALGFSWIVVGVCSKNKKLAKILFYVR